MPGIIGPADDAQVQHVASALRRRGAQPVLLDLGGFPSRLRLSVLDGVPFADGLDLRSVRSWYVRSLPLPMPWRLPHRADPADQAQDYAMGRERRSFLAGFTAGLVATATVLVNQPDRMAQHFRKLEQLDTLRAAGVPVPTTLATNDPVAVAEFAERVGAVVYKPLAGGGLCRRLTAADLRPERLARLATAPVLFQEEVAGDNLRVYVVGGAVAAAYRIESDEVDYRGGRITLHAVGPEPDETEACLRAADACGLAFSGVDLRRRPGGGFAVLECNPSPMFAGVEDHTGTALVSDALAEHLLQAPAAAAGAGSEAGSGMRYSRVALPPRIA